MPLEIELADEAATARLGEDLAAALKPGDLVTLRGDLGAGKTTLARAALRALADDPALEVPSPTFTLVQSYPGRLPAAHIDLYRIGDPGELDELGLDEALEAGVALVEWPERASGSLPQGIAISLSESSAGRLAAIDAAEPALSRIRRSLAIRAFLDANGCKDAGRAHLQGDASSRTYETIALPHASPRILMNAPKQPDGPPIRGGKPYSQIAHLAETVTPFVAIARALKGRGFEAPEVLAADLDSGLLLIEHLGPDGFLDEAGEPVAERYAAAAGLLADLHAKPWPAKLDVASGVVHEIPDYDQGAMAIETELLLDWYLPYVTGGAVTPDMRRAYADAWDAVFDRLEGSETSLVLRDYHSPNLIWRAERTGRDRLGVIDFQDAMIGPAAYDVASLAMDARVDIAPDLEQATVDAYCAAREAAGPFDRPAFERAYAIMAAQRNAKILGIFVRLNLRDGKPHYLKHLPRIRDYFARALRHPALEPVRAFAAEGGLEW